MSVCCPSCGSRFLRESRPRNGDEKFGWLSLKSPLRCLDCQTRFVARTLVFSDFRYARCPKCHRMDLNGWTGKTYDPPLFMGLKVQMGANKWRCEYCRVNFASFRPRKEVFTFNRWVNRQAEVGKDNASSK